MGSYYECLCGFKHVIRTAMTLHLNRINSCILGIDMKLICVDAFRVEYIKQIETPIFYKCLCEYECLSKTGMTVHINNKKQCISGINMKLVNVDALVIGNKQKIKKNTEIGQQKYEEEIAKFKKIFKKIFKELSKKIKQKRINNSKDKEKIDKEKIDKDQEISKKNNKY